MKAKTFYFLRWPPKNQKGFLAQDVNHTKKGGNKENKAPYFINSTPLAQGEAMKDRTSSPPRGTTSYAPRKEKLGKSFCKHRIGGKSCSHRVLPPLIALHKGKKKKGPF
jgi:hypothetical protein